MDIIIIFIYSIIFLILTYPLIFSFSSGVIGSYNSDGPIFLWNAWNFKQSMLRGYFDLYTYNIFYPNLPSLALHTYTMFQSGLVFLLDMFFKNTILSFNIVFLLLNSFTAYFSYKFFNLHIKSKLASFLAGEFFAFQALWSIYTIFGTQNFLGLWYIPAALYFYELHRRKSMSKYSLFCGVTISVAFLNGFYPFIFTVTGLFVYIITLYLFKKRYNIKKFFKFLVYSILTFLILVGWKIFLLFKQLDFIKSIPITSIKDIDRIYYADPINIIRPVQFHSLWGQWHTWFRNVSIENGNAFLGFTFLLVLLIFFYTKVKTKKSFDNIKLLNIFLVSYLLILSLSFGPFLHFFGVETNIVMPHYVIQSFFESYNNIRFPARWLILAQIFLSGIFALILNYIFININKKFKNILGVLVCVGLIIDVAYLPREITNITNTKETEIYNSINNKDNKVVMYLPLSISSGYFNIGETTKRPMVYQMIHEHPIFGGHLSRLPFNYLDDYSNENVINFLLNSNELSQEDFDGFIIKYNIGYIVIDKDKLNIRIEDLKKYLLNSLYFKECKHDEYNEMYIFEF